jgi:mersacidin/lichenicidin family type 2 lantibiotic
MSNDDIIRAWKDEDYWASLDTHKRSQLPENPAGIIELTNTEMEVVAGGYQYPGSWANPCHPNTYPCGSWANPCHPNTYPCYQEQLSQQGLCSL